MKYKNGFVDIFLIIFFIGVILIIILSIISVFKSVEIRNNDCLQKIAEDFCEGEDEELGSSYWFVVTYFDCVKNSRSNFGTTYSFTKQEVKECLKNG